MEKVKLSFIVLNALDSVLKKYPKDMDYLINWLLDNRPKDPLLFNYRLMGVGRPQEIQGLSKTVTFRIRKLVSTTSSLLPRYPKTGDILQGHRYVNASDLIYKCLVHNDLVDDAHIQKTTWNHPQVCRYRVALREHHKWRTTVRKRSKHHSTFLTLEVQKCIFRFMVHWEMKDIHDTILKIVTEGQTVLDLKAMYVRTARKDCKRISVSYELKNILKRASLQKTEQGLKRFVNDDHFIWTCMVSIYGRGKIPGNEHLSPHLLGGYRPQNR